jgi:hypothetical protein
VLRDSLNQHQSIVLKRWRELILSSFPEKGQEFLRQQANQFHNPVGHTLRTETETILQSLIDNVPLGEFHQSIDRIVRIRAVQDCLPSEAVAFVFHLKTAIRETLDAAGTSAELAAEVTELERAIDRLAGYAFDHYMSCKQKIFEIGARAEKMRVAKLLERLSRTQSANENGGFSA